MLAVPGVVDESTDAPFKRDGRRRLSAGAVSEQDIAAALPRLAAALRALA